MINLQRVGFYYITSEDVTIVENAILEADEAGWSVAWNTDRLDYVVVVDLCNMYAIPNSWVELGQLGFWPWTPGVLLAMLSPPAKSARSSALVAITVASQ